MICLNMRVSGFYAFFVYVTILCVLCVWASGFCLFHSTASLMAFDFRCVFVVRVLVSQDNRL